MKKKTKICVVGLGYVGLPLAINFSKHFFTVGYDIDNRRINSLRKGVDTNNLIKNFNKKKIFFTNSLNDIKNCNFYIITVPTPINKKKKPDLSSLITSSNLIGSVLKKNDFVVYESTVYPGLTEDICIKILERASGIKNVLKKEDIGFYCGYSPERINPGDKKNNLKTITKIISANSEYTRFVIKNVYATIIKNIYVAKSIKIAEAAKVIENAQRDINIAFINELALIFSNLNINFREILKAASTKWNFLKFTPGLVGGHCIGVDPYYLSYKSTLSGFEPNVLLSGRTINDKMAKNFAKIFITKLKKKFKNKKFNILVLGLTFKENVKDLRNSKVFEAIDYFKKNHNVDIYDPLIDVKELEKKYKKIFSKINKKNYYHGIFFSTPHKFFFNKKFIFKLEKCCKVDNVFFDLKHKINFSSKKLNIVSS